MDICTLSHYKGYFTFLRNYGIMPYEQIFQNSTSKKSGLDFSQSYDAPNSGSKLVGIGYYKNNFWSFFHFFVNILFFIYTGFVSFQFGKRMLSGDASRVELFGLSCWLWKPIFVISYFFFYHRRKDQISEFLTEWITTERKIYEMSASKSLQNYEAMGKIQQTLLSNHRGAMIYVPFWTLISTLFIGINHAYNIGFSAYISSYVGNPLDPANFQWLVYVSFCVQAYTITISLLAFTHFYTIALQFTRTIVYALEYISYRPPNNNRIMNLGDLNLKNPITIVGEGGPDQLTIEESTQKFHMLEELVLKFNSTFGGMFLLFKTAVMIQYCILFYVPMRYLALVNVSSLFIFFISGIHFSMQLATLLPTMGSVYDLSKKFKMSWLKAFNGNAYSQTQESFYKLNMKMKLLNRCTAFAFEAGGFYKIKQGTMLAFFSIATSYLVVLLQF